MSKTMAPFYLQFNAAVVSMARRVLPLGFDVEPDEEKVPHNLTDLRRQIERTRRIVVWAGASACTIFGDEETNYAFRAWHDWSHWHYCTEFDLPGEYATCEHQIADLRRIYGVNPRMELLLREEVQGQLDFARASGYFPHDQRSFARTWLAEHGYHFS